MRSLIVMCVLLFGFSVCDAQEYKSVLKRRFGDSPSQHVTPPKIYPHTPDMGPGEFYRDSWGKPFRPRPYTHGQFIPRRRAAPPRWNPWPEHNQNPHGRGGHGKGPLFRYYYGPNGWGFRIGPNITR